MLKVLFSPLVLAGHFRGHCRCHALSFLYLCQCGLDSLLEARVQDSGDRVWLHLLLLPCMMDF